MRSSSSPWVALAVVMAWSGLAVAAPWSDGPSCPDVAPEQDRFAYLRSLSLHLRGAPPTVEEYEALEGADDVPLALVDEWLASEAFAQRVVRYHRNLLWNNISQVDFLSNRHAIGTSGDLYFRSNHAIFYRGDYNLPCLDTPATWDEDGELIFEEDELGYLREGWVWATPYWAPDTQIKLCALDAQETLVAPSGDSCGTQGGNDETACGCGPNMQWCYRGEHQQAMREAFGRDVELRIEAVILGDLPYTELFTGTTAFVNGPLVHFFRHFTGLPRATRFDPVAYDLNHLPDLAWQDGDVWVPIALPEMHAGVLTSPAFLLRFQTQRARANRFYDAFLCQPFQPPPGGIPAPDDASVMVPDLQKRAGCKYCHALLEPAGAHWGRWPEYSAGYIEPVQFPAMSDDCLACAVSGGCSDACNRFYLTATLSPEENAYIGMLDAYLFLRDEHTINVEAGPAYLVKSSIVDNRLPTCVARRTAEHLLGRALATSEAEWLEDLTFDFVASGFSYRELVKTVVLDELYRRVR